MPIKYLGSKRLLLAGLLGAVSKMETPGSVVLDLFSGTARVGQALKQAGYRVISNDYTAYGQTIADCYVAADRDEWLSDAERLVAEFNGLAGEPGWFTKTYCEDSRFFQPNNGARIDAIREEIERKGLPPQLRSILLVSLMEAADRVDSTCGVQMAYLKKWAKRSFNELHLRIPEMLPGSGCQSVQMDALEAMSLASDLVYMDPPYNQHSYLGNYHIWESLVLWDKPEVYGVACKRVDVRERKSAFNSKRGAGTALKDLLDRLRGRPAVISFNDEGYISREVMESLLTEYGEVQVQTTDYKRYVGAQIGQHGPDGKRVGEVSHMKNQEYLYSLVCTP